MTFKAENGAVIEVDDCVCSGISDEEMQDRVENMLNTASRIAENNACRRFAEDGEAGS